MTETSTVPAQFQTVSWPVLENTIRREWKQGEHVCIVGPTGVGKTTLIAKIVCPRKYVVVFVTKVHDDTIAKDFPGFDRIYEWPPKSYQNKVLLWPKPGKTIRETIAIQRAVFQRAMDIIFQDKGWTVVFDEQNYTCEELKLEPENRMFLHQGRSSKLSVINGCQRPVDVPVVTYSGSTHAFIWKNEVEVDLKRLAQMAGMTPKDFLVHVSTLEPHEFLYVNTRTRLKARSQVERN